MLAGTEGETRMLIGPKSRLANGRQIAYMTADWTRSCVALQKPACSFGGTRILVAQKLGLNSYHMAITL